MSRPPRAPYGDVLVFADQAISQEEGLVIECQIPRHATNFRMQFYARRSELRDEGNTKYDSLVCTIERLKFVVLKKKEAVVAVSPIGRPSDVS